MPADLPALASLLRDLITEIREPVWLTTVEAARALQVDRGVLDSIAARATYRRPDAVVQVGQGTSRRTYRWRADLLGEAVNAGQIIEGADIESSPSPKM